MCSAPQLPYLDTYFSYADADDSSVIRMSNPESIGKRIKANIVLYFLFNDALVALDSSLGNNLGFRWLLFNSDSRYNISPLFENGVIVPAMRFPTFLDLYEHFLRAQDDSLPYWIDSDHAKKLDSVVSEVRIWDPKTLKNSFGEAFKLAFDYFEPWYKVNPLPLAKKESVRQAIDEEVAKKGFLNRGFLKTYFDERRRHFRGYLPKLKQLRDHIYHLNLSRYVAPSCALPISSSKAEFVAGALDGAIPPMEEGKPRSLLLFDRLKRFKSAILSLEFLQDVHIEQVMKAKENASAEYINYKRELARFAKSKKGNLLEATIEYVKALEDQLLVSETFIKQRRFTQLRDIISAREFHTVLGSLASSGVSMTYPILKATMYPHFNFIPIELFYIGTAFVLGYIDVQKTHKLREEKQELEWKLRPKDPSNTVMSAIESASQ